MSQFEGMSIDSTDATVDAVTNLQLHLNQLWVLFKQLSMRLGGNRNEKSVIFSIFLGYC
jgi:hypothetical protein